MIKKIINGIFGLITSLFSALLYPILNALLGILSPITTLMEYLNPFVDFAFNSIGWCIDFVGIDNNIINLIVIYFGYSCVIPIGQFVIKIAIKWYDAFKL